MAPTSRRHLATARPAVGDDAGRDQHVVTASPQASYDAFLQLYEEEILALDSCLLELINIDATSSGTAAVWDLWAANRPAARRAEGKFAGATWETPAAAVEQGDLSRTLDREFANLAQAFRLQGASPTSLPWWAEPRCWPVHYSLRTGLWASLHGPHLRDEHRPTNYETGSQSRLPVASSMQCD